jgi:hypothetical protein
MKSGNGLQACVCGQAKPFIIEEMAKLETALAGIQAANAESNGQRKVRRFAPHADACDSNVVTEGRTATPTSGPTYFRASIRVTGPPNDGGAPWHTQAAKFPGWEIMSKTNGGNLEWSREQMAST